MAGRVVDETRVDFEILKFCTGWIFILFDDTAMLL